MNNRSLGIMIDCSRNGVMTPENVKEFATLIAGMGYNMLQLYTEDTYEIDGEPFFGYMRGRYTQEELKDIDAHCVSLGIELIPCIQTLAHLERLTRWPAYTDLFDIGDILLVDDERVWNLIDKMFAAVSRCFTSRRVHIGMDEAHNLGLGKYLEKHGLSNRSLLMAKHLTKVTELYNSGEGFNNPEGNPGNNGGVDVFKEGRALFYIEGFGNVQKLRQMDMDFGILPAPKYNEAQEDFVSHGGYPYFTMIPKTNTELDRTGILLESLAYESMQTVKPAFYEINLKGKISRDNDSEAMLDIIFSTLKYDMQIAVAQIHTGVADNYIGTGKTDFASYFTGIEANVQTQIDKLLGSYNNK